jgi:putative ABC transport system ATP-binding protein
MTADSDSPQLALRTTELGFEWPDGQALAFDPLLLRAGERVFLAGPSGSGKSSLLGLIAGTLKPSSGRVEIAGIEASRLRQHGRDRLRADHIGVIFQQFNLLPFLSARDNVELAARFSRRRAQRAAARDGGVRAQALRLLAELGLAGAEITRPAARLSVGQQQRVAAARALLGAPDLVLADEPTSALDSDLREDFIRLLLAECADAGSALLFVSHDRSLQPLFDRSLELARGQPRAAA